MSELGNLMTAINSSDPSNEKPKEEKKEGNAKALKEEFTLDISKVLEEDKLNTSNSDSAPVSDNPMLSMKPEVDPEEESEDSIPLGGRQAALYEKAAEKAKKVKGDNMKKEKDKESSFPLTYKKVNSAAGLRKASPIIKKFSHYSTGSLAIDSVTKGGWPSPLIIELSSDEGVGKTSLLLDAAKRMTLVYGEYVLILDYERGIQYDYLEQLGIPFADLSYTEEEEAKIRETKEGKERETLKELIYKDKLDSIVASKKAVVFIFWPSSFEEGEDIIHFLNKILIKPVKMIAIDSYASMLPAADLESAGMMTMGSVGSYFLKKMNTLNSIWNSFCLVINHIRVDVSRMMWDKRRPSYLPPPEKTYSDGTMKYLAQLRVKLKRGEVITEDVYIPSMNTSKKIKVCHEAIFNPEKQKMFPPVPCRFYISYGKGIDNLMSILDLGLYSGIIKQVGGAYQINRDWAPKVERKVPGKGLTEVPMSLVGKSGFKQFMRENKTVLTSLVGELKEKGLLEYTDALLEIDERYEADTDTFNAPTELNVEDIL